MHLFDSLKKEVPVAYSYHTYKGPMWLIRLLHEQAELPISALSLYTPRELLGAYLQWEGILGYTDVLWDLTGALHGQGSQRSDGQRSNATDEGIQDAPPQLQDATDEGRVIQGKDLGTNEGGREKESELSPQPLV